MARAICGCTACCGSRLWGKANGQWWFMSNLSSQSFKTLEWGDISWVSSGRFGRGRSWTKAAAKTNLLALVVGGNHLSALQLVDLAKLQANFSDVFSPLPGHTALIQHHIETIPGEMAHSCPYRLPEHKKVIQDELKAMLDLGVLEESNSDWASPIVLVPKTDGWVCFCVDYRKVNAVSKFDAYPELTSCLIG